MCYKAMEEIGHQHARPKCKGLADVPIQEIDLVVSFDDAHKKCSNLPRSASVENWNVANHHPDDLAATRANIKGDSRPSRRNR